MSKQLFLWLLVVAVIVIAAQAINPAKKRDLNWTDFMFRLNKGWILEVSVQETKVTGKTVDSDSDAAKASTAEANRKDLTRADFDMQLLPEQVAILTNKIIEYNEKHATDGTQVKFSSRPQPVWVVSMLTTFLPVLLLVGVMIFILRQMQAGGTRAMSFGKSRARLSTGNQNKVTFDDVAGCDEAKEDLQEVVEFLKDSQKYQKLGGKIPKGVLLFGNPGTGKTLLARAVAGEASVPFFSISGSDFVEMFVGVGASRVRDLFDQGKKNAPCIIFIDEIDAVGRQRFAGLGGGHDEREQTLNQLLVEMDGFNANEGVILIAATNRPDTLDPALLRPGRFDRQIVVDSPDLSGRHGILKVHTKNILIGENVDLEVIAKRTPGFSGADLANAVNEAALLAARRNKDKVEMEDFEAAVDKVMAGPEKKSRVMSEKEKKVVAYHESGHALMFLFIDEIDPLHKVSILPRGRALGYTLHLPEEDKYLQSRPELLGLMTAILGGRVAEEIFIGDITTGAQDDLNRVTQLARKMVCEYGMSNRLGPLAFANKDNNVFLGRDYGNVREYSEEIAFEIDKEVRHLIEECYNRARNLLNEHSGELIKLADTLLEREVMDRDEVMILLGLKEPPKPEEKKTPEGGSEKPEDVESPAEDKPMDFGAAPGFPHQQPT